MKRRKSEHVHSVKDYEAAVAVVRASSLSKSRKRKAINKLVNRLVDMI